jgi:regulator of replication initiation timing
MTPEREKEIRELDPHLVYPSVLASFYKQDRKELLAELDKLRYENSFTKNLLKSVNDSNVYMQKMAAMVEELKQELDRLRAESDEAVTEFCQKVNGLEKERDQMKAKGELLCNQNALILVENHQLRARVEKLRKALEHIVSPISEQCCIKAFQKDFIVNHFVDVADEALAKDDEEERK